MLKNFNIFGTSHSYIFTQGDLDIIKGEDTNAKKNLYNKIINSTKVEISKDLIEKIQNQFKDLSQISTEDFKFLMDLITKIPDNKALKQPLIKSLQECTKYKQEKVKELIPLLTPVVLDGFNLNCFDETMFSNLSDEALAALKKENVKFMASEQIKKIASKLSDDKKKILMDNKALKEIVKDLNKEQTAISERNNSKMGKNKPGIEIVKYNQGLSDLASTTDVNDLTNRINKKMKDLQIVPTFKSPAINEKIDLNGVQVSVGCIINILSKNTLLTNYNQDKECKQFMNNYVKGNTIDFNTIIQLDKGDSIDKDNQLYSNICALITAFFNYVQTDTAFKTVNPDTKNIFYEALKVSIKAALNFSNAYITKYGIFNDKLKKTNDYLLYLYYQTVRQQIDIGPSVIDLKNMFQDLDTLINNIIQLYKENQTKFFDKSSQSSGKSQGKINNEATSEAINKLITDLSQRMEQLHELKNELETDKQDLDNSLETYAHKVLMGQTYTKYIKQS